MAFYFSKSRPKFNNQKTIYKGMKFDSKLELNVFLLLEHDQKLGKIKTIERQFNKHITEAKILLKLDFKITLFDESFYYVEAKGMDMPVWQIKKRLWKHYGDAPIHIYKGSKKNIRLEEIILVKK